MHRESRSVFFVTSSLPSAVQSWTNERKLEKEHCCSGSKNLHLLTYYSLVWMHSEPLDFMTTCQPHLIHNWKDPDKYFTRQPRTKGDEPHREESVCKCRRRISLFLSGKKKYYSAKLLNLLCHIFFFSSHSDIFSPCRWPPVVTPFAFLIKYHSTLQIFFIREGKRKALMWRLKKKYHMCLAGLKGGFEIQTGSSLHPSTLINTVSIETHTAN